MVWVWFGGAIVYKLAPQHGRAYWKVSRSSTSLGTIFNSLEYFYESPRLATFSLDSSVSTRSLPFMLTSTITSSECDTTKEPLTRVELTLAGTMV